MISSSASLVCGYWPTSPSERDQHQQRREQRHHAVVGERRRPVGEVVLAELLDRPLRTAPQRSAFGELPFPFPRRPNIDPSVTREAPERQRLRGVEYRAMTVPDSYVKHAARHADLHGAFGNDEFGAPRGAGRALLRHAAVHLRPDRPRGDLDRGERAGGEPALGPVPVHPAQPGVLHAGRLRRAADPAGADPPGRPRQGAGGGVGRAPRRALEQPDRAASPEHGADPAGGSAQPRDRRPHTQDPPARGGLAARLSRAGRAARARRGPPTPRCCAG